MLYLAQGLHCTGKTGKITKNIPCQGKHRKFGNFVKTRGILFAEVVILKVKNIEIFAVKISIFFVEAGYVCQFSFVYVIVKNHVNWHRENLWSDRGGGGGGMENTGNLETQFKWEPCCNCSICFDLCFEIATPISFTMSCFAAFNYTTGIMYVYTALTITRACAKSPKK